MKNKPENYFDEFQIDIYSDGKVAEIARIVERLSDSPVMLQKIEAKLETILTTIRAKRKKHEPKKIMMSYEPALKK